MVYTDIYLLSRLHTIRKPQRNLDETKVSPKNCKFAKHNENYATHYSLIIQSFAPESDFFSSQKKSLLVCHEDHSPGETKWTEFCETLQNTFYTLFMVRTNFGVSSQFRSGMQLVCSPLYSTVIGSLKFHKCPRALIKYAYQSIR